MWEIALPDLVPEEEPRGGAEHPPALVDAGFCRTAHAQREVPELRREEGLHGDPVRPRPGDPAHAARVLRHLRAVAGAGQQVAVGVH